MEERTRNPAHFSRRDLLEALTRPAHFEAGDRRRALVHFGRGCRTCWKNLAEIAGPQTRTCPVDSKEWVSTEEAGAPVGRALRRCLVCLSEAEGEHEEPAAIAGLRPVHRYVLDRTCTEESRLAKALAFRRLVLEECRALTLADPSQLVRRLEVTVEELRDPCLAAQPGSREPMAVLDALGTAYLADDYRVTGRYERAEDTLAEAKKLLDTHPADSEVHATWLELEADLARVRGDFGRALDSLLEAKKRLETFPVPARRAATRIRLGRLLGLVRAGDPETASQDAEAALKEFRTALREIPPGRHPRLRLEAIHAMAALEVRRQCFEDARRTLEVAEPLYVSHSFGSILAERAWLWGVVRLEAKETEEAEKMLWTALTLFEGAERTLDAVRTLIDLGRLYVLAGDSDKLAQTVLRFVAMTCRPEIRKLPLPSRREILSRARESGLRLGPDVHRDLVGDDESEEDEPVN